MRQALYGFMFDVLPALRRHIETHPAASSESFITAKSSSGEDLRDTVRRPTREKEERERIDLFSSNDNLRVLCDVIDIMGFVAINLNGLPTMIHIVKFVRACQVELGSRNNEQKLAASRRKARGRQHGLTAQKRQERSKKLLSYLRPDGSGL
ncbi:hypothetical protein HPP92_027709 [Vanilla planifolia]|uniref:Uncharacterized protein n=1 Tax=Vanilla planifolia TaxID=51239 RepID=A0A835PBX2_VANPL|nr:hypothetical protein HPP92_027709 [Vanilla planifolia]